jgi:hypothetical protein
MLLGALAAIIGSLLLAQPGAGRVSEMVFAPRALAILAGGLMAFGLLTLGSSLLPVLGSGPFGI